MPARQPREREKAVEELGAEQDQKDHAGRLGGLEQAVDQRRAVEPALEERGQADAAGADRGRLGRGEDAGVDAADHQGEDHHDRPDRVGRIEALGPAGAIGDRGRAGPERHIAAHREREQQGGEQPRDQRRLEHGDDAGLDDDRVDHQDHRGRDQDAEGAAGGERAGGERRRVAVPPELGQHHLAHGRGGGERGAADRAEAGAGADRRRSPCRPAGVRPRRWRRGTDRARARPGSRTGPSA